MTFEELSREELIARLRESEAALRALGEAGSSAELLHELQTHQVELEAQNRALRDSQGLLEESRSRYVDLYDFAPIGYCTFDRNGIVLEINLTGAALLGLERSRILGKPFLSIARVHDPDLFVRHLRRARESAAPVVAEIGFSTARNERIDVQMVSSSVHDPASPGRCRTAFLDVSQRRVAERDARESHERERELRGRLEAIDGASAAVSNALTRLSGTDITAFLQTIVDEARRVVGAEYAALGVGKAGERFDPWVFSGMSAEIAHRIGPAPRAVGLLGAVPLAGRPVRLRDVREHPAFGQFPAHHPEMTSFLGVPIRHLGEIRGNLYLANKRGAGEFSEQDLIVSEMFAERVGVAMEIARLRQIEARERARLEFLAQAGPLLAESLELETTLATIARVTVPAAADLAIVDLVEEHGSLRQVAAWHVDPSRRALLERLAAFTAPDHLSEGARAALASGEPNVHQATPEYLARIPDPEYAAIVRGLGVTSLAVVPLEANGRTVGLLRMGMAGSGRRYTRDDLTLARDIARSASLALERARLYRAAQTALRARDSLLAIVSHDLRNYLATIRTSAELIYRRNEREGAEERTQRPVDVIRSASGRMEQLIASLRDATMIEAGQFRIERKPEDPAALVREAIRLAEPQGDARGLHLRAAIEDDLPACACDRERILQVLANLLGNAIKFTEPGGQISVSAHRIPDAIELSVSDTGPGIPAEQLPRIFQRYWKSRAGNANGTGLGLFIAKGIVEAHGGTMRAESTVGAGTSFTFTIPAPSASDVAPEPPSVDEPSIPGEP